MNSEPSASEAGTARAGPESVWVVSYDITDPKRLRRVARILLNHGERIQWSVFCCVLTSWQRRCLADKLESIVDRRVDSVRMYPIRGRVVEQRGPALPGAPARYFVV